MHPNATLAKQLDKWSRTGVDTNDIIFESKRKGFVTPSGGKFELTPKGREFIAKWTAGPPSSTYERKTPAQDEQMTRLHQHRSGFNPGGNGNYVRRGY